MLSLTYLRTGIQKIEWFTIVIFDGTRLLSYAPLPSRCTALILARYCFDMVDGTLGGDARTMMQARLMQRRYVVPRHLSSHEGKSGSGTLSSRNFHTWRPSQLRFLRIEFGCRLIILNCVAERRSLDCVKN